jgi:hypothetical protein
MIDDRLMEGMAFDHLEKLLEPCLAEEFLASSWGKNYRHIRGRAGKFSHLLPWRELNEVLKRHRLDFPRLRLMRDGQSVPVSSYLRHMTPARRKTPIPRLLPTGLTKHLREGATLVLDAVDELSEPLEELAQGLELFFHEHIQINAYAGWHTSRGFDLHWDDHDVFILQVTGRKRWSVYGMTRAYPLAGESEPNPRPTHEPLWDETLEDGDLLYIPRGWWHVALPLDEPTLHLTVGIHNRTGIDLVRWLADRMRMREIFRQDLPRLDQRTERRAHVERLRRELLAEWSEDILDRYDSERDAMAEPRSHFSLPWSATNAVLPPSSDALVCLTAPRPLDLKIEDGVVEFSCHKKRWRFAEDAITILRPLAEGRALSVSELCEAARGRLDERTVRTFLGELILHGLVAVHLD